MTKYGENTCQFKEQLLFNYHKVKKQKKQKCEQKVK